MRLFKCLLPPLLFLSACSNPPSTQTETGIEKTTSEIADTSATAIARQSPKPDCPVSGSVLEDNTYYSAQQELLIAIAADSTTRDPKLGESHRKLLVYHANTCELISQQTLPVDRSADFYYHLAAINYNNAAQQLAICGATQFYLYDLKARSLSGPFQPQFATERYGVDAQSGNIQQLEMWESYLIGYAQDYGAFVFKLNGKNKPAPVFPAAEYQNEIAAYSQAFLLPSDQGTQVLMPSYDRRDRVFQINPAFSKPIALKKEVTLTAQDNRFLLLREDSKNEQAIVIDLKNRKKAELPSDIQRKSNEDVIDWMKVMQ